MNDPRIHYKDTTLRVLGEFQLLEFALKIYIGLSYKAIKLRVENIVHFDYTENDLNDLPLGRLLSLFKKLNPNTALVQRLQVLQTERNHIAHRSLLITMGSMYDRGLVEDKYIEYTMLEDELTECLQLLNTESRSLKERARSAA
jgi:hypothetical protein